MTDADAVLRVIRTVAEAMHALRVPYAVGGSFASSFHGFPRATQDVDIVAELRSDLAAQFAGLVRPDFYIDEHAVADAIARRGSFNIIHLDSMFKVDIFIPGDNVLDVQQLERRVAAILGEDDRMTFSVSTAEDTVLQKLNWFVAGGRMSDRQWSDILGVLRVQSERIDLGYLRETAKEAGLSDVLEDALGAAGCE